MATRYSTLLSAATTRAFIFALCINQRSLPAFEMQPVDRRFSDAQASSYKFFDESLQCVR